MEKVWNDGELHEIKFLFSGKKIKPDTKKDLILKKNFSETVTVLFEEHCDLMFSENPVVFKSRIKKVSVKCSIPGVYSIVLKTLNGPFDRYKIITDDNFEIFQTGDKMQLAQMTGRW